MLMPVPIRYWKMFLLLLPQYEYVSLRPISFHRDVKKKGRAGEGKKSYPTQQGQGEQPKWNWT